MPRRRALRHVEIDTNYWKSFVHERLATPMGDAACISIFGRRAVQHHLFAEHLTAEYRVCTEGRCRTVDEWKFPAPKPDNHWLDCVVGCAAAASMRGVRTRRRGRHVRAALRTSNLPGNIPVEVEMIVAVK